MDNEEMVNISVPRRYVEAVKGDYEGPGYHQTLADTFRVRGHYNNAFLTYAIGEALAWQDAEARRVTLETLPGTKVQAINPADRDDQPWTVIGPSYGDGGPNGWLVVQFPGEGEYDGFRPSDLETVEVNDG